MEYLLWVIKLIKVLYNVDWQPFFEGLTIKGVLASGEKYLLFAVRWVARFIFGQSPRLTYLAIKKRYNRIQEKTKFRHSRKKWWVQVCFRAPVIVIACVLQFWLTLFAIFIPFFMVLYLFHIITRFMSYLVSWRMRLVIRGDTRFNRVMRSIMGVK